MGWPRTPIEEFHYRKASLILLGWLIFYQPLRWLLVRVSYYSWRFIKELDRETGHMQEYVDSL